MKVVRSATVISVDTRVASLGSRPGGSFAQLSIDGFPEVVTVRLEPELEDVQAFIVACAQGKHVAVTLEIES